MTRRVLAFDTSANVTSVAICEGSRVLHEDDSPSVDRHAETLLPRIERALLESELTLEQIDLIAVGIGPGSFTGVRVGVASAKGFGLALARPVCGVVSLSALALGALADGTTDSSAQVAWLAPMLDAFKGEVFAALYRPGERGLECEVEPFHATPSEARKRIEAAAPSAFWLFGGGLRRYADAFAALPSRASVLDDRFDAPRARHVARLGAEAFERGEVTTLAELAPRYLRDSDAVLPKTPLRL